MMPTKLTALDPEAERMRYAAVCSNNRITLPGLIVEADETSGRCVMLEWAVWDGSRITSKATEYHLAGLKILPWCR